VWRQLDLQGRKVEDVLMKTNDDSLGSLLNRVRAFRRGDIVFISIAGGVEEKYKKYQKVFPTLLASFHRIGRQPIISGQNAPRTATPAAHP